MAGLSARVDVAVVGAGAAGLMAAVQAARAGPGGRVVALDGARTLGAKILVSGGGRCNVTHDEVDETAFSGSSPAAIRTVLRRFSVEDTIGFFRDLGVALEREETGKLFPVTDRARTVLDAITGAARSAGVEVRNPWRVTAVTRAGEGFLLESASGERIHAARVVLATGGRSLPRTGSDGGGYALARALGHSVTPQVFPALVPLLLAEGHPLRRLAGISADVVLEVRGSTGRRRVALAGSLLCTHFGISGPVVLDVSRHLTAARIEDPGAVLVARWRTDHTAETLDAALRALGRRTVAGLLQERLPERLARALGEAAGVDPKTPGHRLARTARAALVHALLDDVLPVTGDRGFSFAEVTAGGVPLRELRLDTMESRIVPGLHLCGEICDVDGRIGGYNFQWAWASGFVAGRAAGTRDAG